MNNTKNQNIKEFAINLAENTQVFNALFLEFLNLMDTKDLTANLAKNPENLDILFSEILKMKGYSKDTIDTLQTICDICQSAPFDENPTKTYFYSFRKGSEHRLIYHKCY